MILHALCALAEREGLLTDLDYEYKRVAWLVRVGPEGKLLSIEGTHQPVIGAGRAKQQLQPKQFLIPRQPTGRAGTKAPAAFLVDNAKYVLGLSTKDKEFSDAEGKEKSAWFREAVDRCADSTRDEGAVAVSRFLQSVATANQHVALPDEAKSNELFAFVVFDYRGLTCTDAPILT